MWNVLALFLNIIFWFLKNHNEKKKKIKEAVKDAENAFDKQDKSALIDALDRIGNLGGKLRS